MELDQFDLDKRQTDEVFKELVEKALLGEHSKFEFIRSYEMLKVARLYRSGVKKVSKLFKKLESDLLKSYALDIQNSKQDLELLMTIKQFGKCAQYYKEEHAIVKDMISEYRVYVESGHILHTIFGGIRPDHECIDYRKLPIKWF